MGREKKTIIQVELSGECFMFVLSLEMCCLNGAGIAVSEGAAKGDQQKKKRQTW